MQPASINKQPSIKFRQIKIRININSKTKSENSTRINNAKIKWN